MSPKMDWLDDHICRVCGEAASKHRRGHWFEPKPEPICRNYAKLEREVVILDDGVEVGRWP